MDLSGLESADKPESKVVIVLSIYHLNCLVLSRSKLALLRSVLEPVYRASGVLAESRRVLRNHALTDSGKLHRVRYHRPVQDNLSLNHYCSSMQPAERFLPLNVSGSLLPAFPARILTIEG
jgi:hypothetical protein